MNDSTLIEVTPGTRSLAPESSIIPPAGSTRYHRRLHQLVVGNEAVVEKVALSHGDRNATPHRRPVRDFSDEPKPCFSIIRKINRPKNRFSNASGPGSNPSIFWNGRPVTM